MSVADQEVIFDNDLNAMVEALKGNGVLNGLQVTASETPDLYVHVSAGSAFVNGKYVEVTSTVDLSITPDSSNPRKDIVVLDENGTVSLVTGTPEAADPVDETGRKTYAPKPPDIPAGKIILAEIWVPTNATAITNDEIYDRRILINDIILEEQQVFEPPDWRHQVLTGDVVVSDIWDTVFHDITKQIQTQSDQAAEWDVPVWLPKNFVGFRKNECIFIKWRVGMKGQKITITVYDTEGTEDYSESYDITTTSDGNMTIDASNLDGTYNAGKHFRIHLKMEHISGYLSTQIRYSSVIVRYYVKRHG